MSTDTKWMQKSVTRTGGGAPGVFDLLGADALLKPPLITSPNVYAIPTVVAALDKIAEGKKGVQIPEVEELWQFGAEFSGPNTPQDSDVWIVAWPYSIVAAAFGRPLAPMRFVGDNLLITAGLGRVVHVPGVLGVSHIGLQAFGLDAANSIHWLHEWS